METDRSILLQKKTILFLSLIIGSLFGVIYSRELKLQENETYLNNVNLITVNASEDKNKVIRENTKYLSAIEIVANNNMNMSVRNDEKNETFAGDMTILVDQEKNENVANVESTNDTNITENAHEIITETIENVEVEQVVKVEENNNQEEKKEQKAVKYKTLAEDNPPTEYLKVVEANATAYCLCKKCCGKNPDHPAYGYTRSGIKIEVGTGIKVIAVDPNVIPLNSKVYVEGLNGAWDYGHAIAADTGSAIKNLKIDLYMDTHEEALQWGRKKVNVYVLGE